MAKMSKLDRMSITEGALGEDSLEDIKEAVTDAMTTLEKFEDNRTSAAESFAEAQNYHEERDWESRDSSLEEADGALTEMSEALDEIETVFDVITLPEGRMETMRKMVSEAQDHLANLL